MKNKSTIGLQSRSLLVIFGMTVALLFSTSSQIVLASPQGGIPGSTDSNSNQGVGSAAQCNPPTNPHDPPFCGPQDQPNNAEQSQGSSQGSVPPNNADVSCVEDPYKCCEQDPSKCGPQGTAPTSSSSGAPFNSNQQAIDHINQAQSSLQNGDTAEAQQHMDLAKKALTPCNPGDPHC